nr:MAG TPA: hypothetical protein [Caudoviricetes sp.]
MLVPLIIVAFSGRTQPSFPSRRVGSGISLISR